ncbi:hypothetical protein SHIRM173S_03420 [Streptomyces hirsutus]
MVFASSLRPKVQYHILFVECMSARMLARLYLMFWYVAKGHCVTASHTEMDSNAPLKVLGVEFFCSTTFTQPELRRRVLPMPLNLPVTRFRES